MLYKLTYKDFREANQAFFRHQRFWYFFCWGICVYFAFRGLFATFYESSYIAGFYNFAIAALIFPLDINIFWRASVWLAWKRNSNCHIVRALELSPVGYTLIDHGACSMVEWNIYSCVIETRNLFVLYQSQAYPFQLFPKRAFGALREVESFRRLVREAGLEILPR
jgi:YcxB-like protein